MWGEFRTLVSFELAATARTSPAAIIADLEWGTGYVTERAVNATVARIRLKDGSASFAIIEKLTRIGRHRVF